jgi:hypothetical protein
LSVHLPTYHLNQPRYVPNFLRSYLEDMVIMNMEG